MGLAKDMYKDNKKILLLAVGLLLLSLLGVFLMNSGYMGFFGENTEGLYKQPENVIEEGIDYKVRIRTQFGDILIDLYEQEAPNSVNSFLFLAKERFYEGLTFHRVYPGEFIQAGDHVGDGNGNPGYPLAKDTNSIQFEKYTVAMVNGSQFFIVTGDANTQGYTVMGRVVSGYSVVDSIEKATLDSNSKPINDIIINSILIIEE
jgi:peptidylprolyl isomerase